MNFTLKGVGYNNKGAQMMLLSVVQEITSWSTENSISAHIRTGRCSERVESGLNHLLQIYNPKLHRISIVNDALSLMGKIIPNKLRKRLHVTLESEVDVYLDASGFAYSDQWGCLPTSYMAQLCKSWKDKGKKIIFLPQAFGPFECSKTIESFSKIVDNSDLIFVRDDISFSHIRGLDLSMENIHLAPDFTNLLPKREPHYINSLEGRPCIVPNARMLDKLNSNTSKKYIEFITEAINVIANSKLRPFILIHEGDDLKLGHELVMRSNPPLQLVKENDPFLLKGILGKCSFVLGSRYHGLVSALSQEIPCLSIGWSHKYEMLFEDYTCEEFVLNLKDDRKYNIEKVISLFDDNFRREMSEKILLASDIQKKKTLEMWNKVREIIY